MYSMVKSIRGGGGGGGGGGEKGGEGGEGGSDLSVVQMLPAFQRVHYWKLHLTWSSVNSEEKSLIIRKPVE